MIHGHTWKGGASPTYRSWQSMIQRCHNPRAENFDKYGARGVSVCASWHYFPTFLADMGERPAGATLDRIDGAGNYEPGNCRWASASTQNANRRTARLITINGQTATLTEWARRARVSDTAMLYRVRRGVTGTALLRQSRHGKAL